MPKLEAAALAAEAHPVRCGEARWLNAALVAEDGKSLSGGERQRLSIARAMLKNAPILILDEATSALDNITKAPVQRALRTLVKGRTTFVIAHRLATIRNATRILVFNNGSVVETGTYDELVKRGGAWVGGRRCTLPLLPPPQKNRSAPSDLSPDTPTPGGMSSLSRTSPVLGSMRLRSLSSPSQVPCQSSPSIQVTPVTMRLHSMVRSIAPVSGST